MVCLQTGPVCYHVVMPSADRKQKRPDLGLQGPEIAVAFANTALAVPVHQRPARTRKLPPKIRDYDSFLGWGVSAGALEGLAMVPLRRAAEQQVDDAVAAFREAMELRAFLLDVCQKMFRASAPHPEDVVKLRDFMDGMRLVAVSDPAGDGFIPQVELAPGLRHLTLIVAGSAFRLMTTGKRLDIRRCSGKDCQQIVLSTTGRSRTWCEIGLCTDRAKTRR
jgi:predicted RNA-binding Zn ribbon-like protein